MKICHFTSAHPSTDIRIFIKECQSLAKEDGFEVTLVAPNTENNCINNVNVVGVPSPAGGRMTRFIKTSQVIYHSAKRLDADVYHFHDPEMIFYAYLLKLKGNKVIYDVHEDVPRQIMSKQWIPKPLRRLISFTFEQFENFCARRFDAIIGATPFITERFKRLGCKAVNVNNFPILKELYIPDVDWSSKEKAVCYMGGINQVRGMVEMTEAIGKTDARLLLGGKFLSKDLKAKVESMDGWRNVEDMGFLNREDVARTLSKSVAGLVLFHEEPNHVNSQPNKMFEYMSAGLPVISSNFNLWRDIVEGNDCGICVDPLDTDAIAKAIDALVSDPEKAKRMGDNGREAIHEKYNWEQESKSLISLYKEIAN
jgi:glycosyltransferase involved in cell wall biosynthesis